MTAIGISIGRTPPLDRPVGSPGPPLARGAKSPPPGSCDGAKPLRPSRQAQDGRQENKDSQLAPLTLPFDKVRAGRPAGPPGCANPRFPGGRHYSASATHRVAHSA
jgi:hypothetical protein